MVEIAQVDPALLVTAALLHNNKTLQVPALNIPDGVNLAANALLNKKVAETSMLNFITRMDLMMLVSGK